VAEFTSRLAVTEDVPALTALMDAAIAESQRAFLDDDQTVAGRHGRCARADPPDGEARDPRLLHG
jgi:hypothetical protein